jgi:hypothetical protein
MFIRYVYDDYILDNLDMAMFGVWLMAKNISLGALGGSGWPTPQLLSMARDWFKQRQCLITVDHDLLLYDIICYPSYIMDDHCLIHASSMGQPQHATAS